MAIAEQAESFEQHQEMSTLGMWVFLSTEVMFFGALFLAYTVYRLLYPVEFAEASHHLNEVLGSINTAVLLCSSLTMALAVHYAQVGSKNRLFMFLLLTALLGIGFLGIKAVEYSQEYHEHLMPIAGLPFDFNGASPDKARLFFYLYFLMTGLHSIHLMIGILVVSTMALFSRRKHFLPANSITIEVVGLYWHFVDMVWIFLFPLLYLIRMKGV